jgi:hypothetical protein
LNAPEARTAVAQAAEAATQSELDRLLQRPFSTRDMLVDDTLDKVMRLAEFMASGRVTCPKHLQGNPADCAAIIMQAMRWGMDHNVVAGKTHLVNGNLGYEAQLIIALLNSSPLLATRLDFRFSDGWAGLGGKDDKDAGHWCEVFATLRGETQPRVLRVSMAQVGSVRNSPNWASDARQQLAYLAAKRWGRLHAPDVVMGVYTPDELQYGRDEDAPPITSSTSAPPPPAAPAMPAYSDADMAKNLPAWTKLVESGKKTPGDLLAMLSTKATFSDAQREKILALKKAAPPADEAPPPAADGHAAFVADIEAAEGSVQ